MFSHSYPWLPMCVDSGKQHVSLAFFTAVSFISLHLKGLPNCPSQWTIGVQRLRAGLGFRSLVFSKQTHFYFCTIVQGICPDEQLCSSRFVGAILGVRWGWMGVISVEEDRSGCELELECSL